MVRWAAQTVPGYNCSLSRLTIVAALALACDEQESAKHLTNILCGAGAVYDAVAKAIVVAILHTFL